MKPIIGVTPSIENETAMHFSSGDNIHVLSEAGGAPVILPYVPIDNGVEHVAEMIDGLYLTGGNDIDPTLFDEEPHPKLGEINPIRDQYELLLIKKMLELKKPILAVCRGCQVLNIAMGGDMYQDIYSQINRDLLQHSQHAPKAHGSHYVNVTKDSLFYSIAGEERIKVNSRHHQANRIPGENVLFSGISSDGIVEVMESTIHPFVLGVQWHPENMVTAGDIVSKNIFQHFIAACK